MAGPIRNLLERRPLRNAVRGLLGLQPRYGMSAVETVGATDSMQGSSLNAIPTRRQPAPVDNTPYVSTTVAKPPVAPSPEARAVSMARTQDSQNRQEARRQEEGIAAPAPAHSEPRKPESGGFSMAIPASETDAPPQNPLLLRAASLQEQASADRARAAKILQSPVMQNPSAPGYAILAAQAENLERRAFEADGIAAGLQSQVYGQDYALRVGKQRDEAALAIERIRKPEESLPRDSQAFRDTVLMSGIGPAAQMATDAYFAAAQAGNIPPGDPTYIARLRQNQMQAAGVSVAASAYASQRDGKSRYRIDSPALIELASVVQQIAPDDAQQRAVLVAQIVSSAQTQARFTPQFANAFNTHLRSLIEAQILRMEEE